MPLAHIALRATQPRGIKFDGQFSYHYVRGSTRGFLPAQTNVPVFRYN